MSQWCNSKVLKLISGLIHQGAVLSLTGVQCPASEPWERWERGRWWWTTTPRQSALTLTNVTAFILKSWPWNASWTSTSKRSGHTRKDVLFDKSSKKLFKLRISSYLFIIKKNMRWSMIELFNSLVKLRATTVNDTFLYSVHGILTHLCQGWINVNNYLYIHVYCFENMWNIPLESISGPP